MKLLLYCTKAKPYLYHNWENCPDTMNEIDLGYILIEPKSYREYDENGNFLGWNTYGKELLENGEVDGVLNGKIVGECDYEVEKISKRYSMWDIGFSLTLYETKTLNNNTLLKRACLNTQQMDTYISNGGYAIHIKNLYIFDKPKELSDYAKLEKFIDEWHTGYSTRFTSLKQAPQNMCYAYKYNWSENKLDKYILISIKPEWLCKILNSEKTIEVRKKVLKEML